MAKKMVRVCFLLIVFPLLLVLGDFILPRPVMALSSVSVIAFDQLVRPGRPVRLEVRLVTGGLSFVRRPISGERIEFMLEDRSLGQALTGGDGIGVKFFTPAEPGLYVITVELVENPRYEAEPVELIVAARITSDPILVVHLSAIQEPSHPPQIPFLSTPTTEPMAEAAGALSELTNQFQILYLETGHESLLSQRKIWLSNEEFPRAPLFAWQPLGDLAGRKERMAEGIRDLRSKGWERLTAVVTRSVQDAESLVQMGIKAVVMMDEDDDTELPDGAEKITDWKAVPAALKAP